MSLGSHPTAFRWKTCLECVFLVFWWVDQAIIIILLCPLLVYQILHCQLELYWEQVFQLWRQLSQTSQVRLINKELNKYVLIHGALLATGFPIVLNFLEVTNGPILSFISFFFLNVYIFMSFEDAHVCMRVHTCLQYCKCFFLDEGGPWGFATVYFQYKSGHLQVH